VFFFLELRVLMVLFAHIYSYTTTFKPRIPRGQKERKCLYQSGSNWVTHTAKSMITTELKQEKMCYTTIITNETNIFG